MNKTYIQDYEIKGNIIEITAGSGNKYQLTHKSCTCKGFSFRRTCGHIKEAKEKGLLDMLTERQKKITTISMSESRRKTRKDAIRKFLKKNNVTFDETLINKLEKYITQETTPEKVLQIAKGENNA